MNILKNSKEETARKVKDMIIEGIKKGNASQVFLGQTINGEELTKTNDMI